MALVKRHIRVSFTLGAGSFGDGKGDTFTVEGLRTSATIVRAGAIMAECNLRIMGMPLDIMNKLTILGSPLIDGRNNTITVEAGTSTTGLAVVFQGIIQEAWIDARNMPQVGFIVMARTGLIAALKPVPPTSYKGSIEIALAMSGIAGQLGLQFENGGVAGVIADPYLHGCLADQARDLAQAAHCNFVIDHDVLAIWPLDGVRKGAIPVISPDTGMVGYPLRTQTGFSVQSLFNPSINFGGAIQVESDITQANGAWAVYSLTHDLEAETPGGKWFTLIDCNLFGKGG